MIVVKSSRQFLPQDELVVAPSVAKYGRGKIQLSAYHSSGAKKVTLYKKSEKSIKLLEIRLFRLR